MKLFCRVIIVSLLSVNLDLAQTNWLRKPANLILDGVPNISASLATDLAVYRSSFADSLVGWDPIELQPIIKRVHGYAGELWKVPRAGEPPELLLKLPNFTESVYCNRRTGDFVFRIDDSLGGERYQLYRYVAGAGDPLRLTDGESANFYPLFSNAGDWVMYSSPKRNGKHMDLSAVKPIDPKSDHLVAQLDAEDWAPFDFSPDDRMVVISDYKSESESYLWTLDIATGEKRLLTSPGKKTTVFNGPSALFSKDGKGIYHITDRDSGFYRLAYINIDTRRYTYLTGSIPWDVEEFVLSPDRTLLAYTVNEAGFSQLHIIDTSQNKELSIPKIPRGVISSLCWHNDGNHLGFKCSSGSVPGDIYAVEISSRKLEHWTSTSDATSKRVPEPKLIKWKSFDGRLISGFLYLPPGETKAPRAVIIDIHGGPEFQVRPDFRDVDNYFTLRLGIAMIYPNIRGSTGYGKAFSGLDNGIHRQDAVKDIGALLGWIERQPQLDAKRVVVRGESYGGYVAFSVAADYSPRIKGSIANIGPSNLVTFLEHTDISVRDQRRAEFGDERDPKVREILERISPLHNANRVTKPLLVIHGKGDPRVPYSQSDQMVAAVRKVGTQVWYLLSQNEGHGLSGDSGIYSLCAQALFVSKALLDN